MIRLRLLDIACRLLRVSDIPRGRKRWYRLTLRLLEARYRTANAATMLTRRTFLPFVALICNGGQPHYAPMPRVHADGPIGDVRCGECGASMSVVDIITVEQKADWSSLNYLSRGRRYFGV